MTQASNPQPSDASQPSDGSQTPDNSQAAGDHYFTAQPSSEVKERTVAFSLDGKSYELTTASGVFSGQRLDLGTSVLLNKVTPPESSGVYLDLGCGYGPITAVLASRAEAEIWAVDVNERALELTRRNTKSLPGKVTAVAPEDVPTDIQFDEIWSNPPIKVGKAQLHEILETWLPRLKPEGVAWLVVSKHLGGDSLATWLESKGWTVDKHASAKGYRVLKVNR